MRSSSNRDLDVVLFGATGFTGRLVAAHLARAHLGQGLRLALAGRDRAKLERVRDDLVQETPVAKDLPILVADAHDSVALAEVAKKTRVVATTVGPYAKYGAALVAACAENGTHYADLTGEVTFIRRTIDRHHARAKETGARIVHTCGYDSIPSDIGAWFVVRAYRERFGEAPETIVHAAGESRGGASGGTIASALYLFEEASRDRAVRRLLADPYALVPGAHGPDRGEQMGVRFDRTLGMWTGPFVMAAVNARVVRRTSALLEEEAHAGYGGARYVECMSTGKGPGAAVGAAVLAAGLGLVTAGLAIGPLRRFAAERWLPKPGEGPSESVRERGYFVSRFAASGRAGTVRAKMRGEGDPGYAATARMLGESAMCLAKDALTSPGGVRTPASTMAEPLLARLRAQRFTLELEG
ncbi:MAG: saccharopine dehydrogenase NADP-binding domain-containing protein [Sandaracinaceae bacterium]